VIDIAAKVEGLLEKEDALLARAVAQTMKRYHDDPSAKNLRDMEAAQKAMKKAQAQKPPKPNAHEKALASAHRRALAAVKKRASVENIKAVEAAERALSDYRARRAAAAGAPERRFKTLKEVLSYLKDEGWKVEKSKLYADKNKIDRQKDGSYLAADVDRYAKLCLSRLDGSDETPVDAAEKLKWEIEFNKQRAKKLELENEVEKGRWLLRSEVSQMFAARAALLKDAVGPAFIHPRVADVIELVGGDQAKAPELIAWWLREVEKHMDQYSRPLEFAVPAQTKGEEDTR